jgi:excisionase family DNA binding protein
MDRLLLKPAEAADLIGVGRSKIYALLATGELPSVRVGASVRVPATALRSWVDQQARAATRSGRAPRR